MNEALAVRLSRLQQDAVSWNVIIVLQRNDVADSQRLNLAGVEIKLLISCDITEYSTGVAIDSLVIFPSFVLQIELFAHADENDEEDGDACRQRIVRANLFDCL